MQCISCRVSSVGLLAGLQTTHRDRSNYFRPARRSWLTLVDPTVELPGHFSVWLATEQARFLNHKFLWANWDAEELLARKKEIEDSNMLTWLLQGVPI